MTIYRLSNGEEDIIFNSEKEACEYLGVSRGTVSSCYGRGSKCKGFDIERLGDTFHRESKTRLHKIWEGMIARCEYKKTPALCRLWRKRNSSM